MRVALVSATTVHHQPGDAAERLNRLATLLDDRGHEVTVLSAQWWDGEPATFEREGVTYRAVTRTPQDWQFPYRLPLAIRRARPDVVHSVCQPPGHMIGARIGATLAGAPLVVECYDPPMARSRLASRLYAIGGRSADAVVTPSRTVKTRVREFGVAPEDIHVIPTGIDMAQIRVVDPAPGGDIVFSRRLDDASNLETLLLGLAEFREYDWGVTIIGDGPRRADFERQAADLRIDDRVEFVGEKPLEERLAFFKDAHVYVHTAEYTPFAIELLRALAAGCVGIVEYQEDSSAHELVEQEERGFLATSAQELTERLVQARNLERLTVDEGFEPYDQESFVKRYEELYRTLAT